MRTIINKELVKYKNHSIALLFSGGMDSLSLLLSCIDVGIKPHLYTFKLKNYDSEDFNCSKKIANIFNLKITEIIIDDSNLDKLIDDIKYIIKTFKVKKKTQIQCIYPFLYIVNEVKENIVLTGLCADDLYGSSRKMQELGRKDLKEFNLKRELIVKDLKASSYIYIKQIFESHNIKFIAPYKENQDLINYFMNKTFKELHSPKQKNVMYENYETELLKYNLYRKNSNLQCNSKIRESHDRLLNSKYNINNNKAITGIYNRLYKEAWKDV